MLGQKEMWHVSWAEAQLQFLASLPSTTRVRLKTGDYRLLRRRSRQIAPMIKIAPATPMQASIIGINLCLQATANLDKRDCGICCCVLIHLNSPKKLPIAAPINKMALSSQFRIAAHLCPQMQEVFPKLRLSGQQSPSGLLARTIGFLYNSRSSPWRRHPAPESAHMSSGQTPKI
jgi:hypothetical protein